MLEVYYHFSARRYHVASNGPGRGVGRRQPPRTTPRWQLVEFVFRLQAVTPPLAADLAAPLPPVPDLAAPGPPLASGGDVSFRMADGKFFAVGGPHHGTVMGEYLPWGVGMTSLAVKCHRQNHIKCTRSLSVLTYGGGDKVEEALGAWLVDGLASPSAADHRAKPRPVRVKW